MSALKIAPDIYWVGAVDWNIRHFHGYTYSTHHGTTYNAYLIIDDAVTLIDTVHAPFTHELIENIQQIVPLDRIENIIANHVETDHSGALPHLLKRCPKATVYGTEKCRDGLAKQYQLTWKNSDTNAGGGHFKVVKTGDTIKLGKRSLSFIEAPMIHWPDSMFTYCPEEKLLLPNDAFGQHYATSERFNDTVDPNTLMYEAKVYYANILWPLGSVIARKIDEINNMKLRIDMIAPSHGVIWRKNPIDIVNAYTLWAKNATRQKIVIVYETMWQATAAMARKIAEGAIDSGKEVLLYDITQSDRTDIVTEMLDAKGFIIGSSTHDNDMLPNLAAFLELLKGLKPMSRIGAAFGSYGWAGGAIKEIEDVMKKCGIEQAVPGIGVKYSPTPDELKQCYDLGKSIAARIG